MKNILLIGVVFWLLFLGGFSTLSNIFKTYNNAPQVIVNGANRIAQTVSPVQQPVRSPVINSPLIIPKGMPVLPTATPAQATPTAAPIIAVVEEQDTDNGTFWTDEELAAFTATADAFYTNIPTPPAEFVEYAVNACANAPVKSPLCP